MRCDLSTMSSEGSENDSAVDSEEEEEDNSSDEEEVVEAPKLELPSRATRGRRMNKVKSLCDGACPFGLLCSSKAFEQFCVSLCSSWKRKTARMTSSGTRTSSKRKRLTWTTSQSRPRQLPQMKTSQSR